MTDESTLCNVKARMFIRPSCVAGLLVDEWHPALAACVSSCTASYPVEAVEVLNWPFWGCTRVCHRALRICLFSISFRDRYYPPHGYWPGPAGVTSSYERPP